MPSYASLPYHCRSQPFSRDGWRNAIVPAGQGHTATGRCGHDGRPGSAAHRQAEDAGSARWDGTTTAAVTALTCDATAKTANTHHATTPGDSRLTFQTLPLHLLLPRTAVRQALGPETGGRR
ncbi:hypothetical protein GCM10010278_73850 [Streptomyces melanogenes]|nr:hypothetical protein GCM10010278_73850 [Streptomyces melanogenes]